MTPCYCSAYPFPHRHTGGKCQAPQPVIKQNNIFIVTPEPACRFCRGTGEVAEHHPYGDTTATEYLTCDCVTEQLPEGFNERRHWLEIKL